MADAWTDLGTVLGLAGRREEAAEALRKALSIHEAKGNVLSAASTKEGIAALS